MRSKIILLILINPIITFANEIDLDYLCKQYSSNKVTYNEAQAIVDRISLDAYEIDVNELCETKGDIK